MPMLVFALVVTALAAAWAGFEQLLTLEALSKALLINTILAVTTLLVALSIAQLTGLMPERWAEVGTMALYSAAAGYFIGAGCNLFFMRKKAGDIEYMHRSFWTDAAPPIISFALVLFGIYRTGLFSGAGFTGIGITSGVSLIGFGFWGWTLRVVPEFRRQSILVLDGNIKWKNLVAYHWEAEETLLLEYTNAAGQITDYRTFIPAEDQLIIERLLSRKMEQRGDEKPEQQAPVRRLRNSP